MKRKLLFTMMMTLVACFSSTTVKAQNWSGSTVSNANNKTVYLWNVGAKKFLGKGGRWGTEAVVSNVGTPFKLSGTSTFTLGSLVQGQNSSSNGYLQFMNGKVSVHDAGNFFVDRATASDITVVGDKQTEYQFKITTTEGSSDKYIGTFYLFADMTKGKLTGVKSVPSDSTAYSQWIIVTEDERKDYFTKAEASSASAVPATFLMYDQDFARNDNSVSYWKTMKSSSSTSFDGQLSYNATDTLKPSYAYAIYTHTYTNSRWGTTTVTNYVSGNVQEKNTPTITEGYITYTYTSTVVTSPNYVYYVGNGYGTSKTTVDEDGKTIDESHWQELYGGDWTANIHGSFGAVQQTLSSLPRAGWYKVSCVGFTTAGTDATAQLYASVGGSTTTGNEYAATALKTIDSASRPTTYVKASKLLNTGSTYEASVLVYVGETTKSLAFGIKVNGAQASDWTCFDNFQLEYLGNPRTNLVLDEDQTNGDYIKSQVAKDETAKQTKQTLYLHRSLNANVWNSIVLPVDLTVSQFQSAFGDDAKLSAFKGAINEDMPTRLYFEEVNIDRDHTYETAIKAGKLYIIKPTKSEPTSQTEVKVPETESKLTSYYKIVGVNPLVDKTIDYSSKVKGEEGDETFGSDTKCQFVGTYVKLGDDTKIPANSYVLNGNNKGGVAGLWYYRTKETASKGFRGWLETNSGTAEAKKISFSINGIVDEGEVTAIEGLEVNPATAKNAAIYNLSGQLVRSGAAGTEGLAKGVYIQNGKKFIVK